MRRARPSAREALKSRPGRAVVGLAEACALLLLLLLSRQFKQQIAAYAAAYDSGILEIADYTLLVTNLPETLTPEEASDALIECALTPWF